MPLEGERGDDAALRGADQENLPGRAVGAREHVDEVDHLFDPRLDGQAVGAVGGRREGVAQRVDGRRDG